MEKSAQNANDVPFGRENIPIGCSPIGEGSRDEIGAIEDEVEEVEPSQDTQALVPLFQNVEKSAQNANDVPFGRENIPIGCSPIGEGSRDEIGAIEDEVEEVEPSQDTQALVDMMILDGVEDGADDQDDGSFAIVDSSDEEDEDEVDEGFFVKEVRDIADNQRVTSVVTDYELDDSIFTEADVQEWRKKEENLLQKHKDGYYRCKVKQGEMYHEILKRYSPYITREALQQLHHPWHTQRNEAMNQSVSAFAPKGKTYSLSTSLDSRVGIAAGVRNVGYKTLWSTLFSSFRLTFDSDLDSYLTDMDTSKSKKRERSETIEGKRKRSKRKREKLQRAQQLDTAARKEGTAYESGMAFKAARRNAKKATTNKIRNPEGTPQRELRCRYHHPDFCTTLGHTRVSSSCFMYKRSKAERDAAAEQIRDEQIAIALQEDRAQKGTYTHGIFFGSITSENKKMVFLYRVLFF